MFRLMAQWCALRHLRWHLNNDYLGHSSSEQTYTEHLETQELAWQISHRLKDKLTITIILWTSFVRAPVIQTDTNHRLSQCGHQKENVRGVANENHGGTCTKHSYLRCRGCIQMHKMLLFYSCNSAGIKWMTTLRKAAWRRRMKGATQVFLWGVAIFYELCGWFLLWLSSSACIELVTGMIQCACQSELTHHPFP